MSKCTYHENCKGKSICEETNVCIAACESKTHFHCAINGCYATNNICFKNDSFFCHFHCEEINHLHCSDECEKLKDCEDSSKCIRHCTAKNHGHCPHSSCDSIKICDLNNFFNYCLNHCSYSNHNHCINCDSKILCEKSKYFKCVKCCQGDNHGHCTTFCDETENMCRDFKCKKHCSEIHQKNAHCVCYGCDFKIFCEKSNNFKCVQHCNILEHQHCIFLCDSMSLCENSRCIKHCKDKTHNHCSVYQCGSLEIYENTKCYECYKFYGEYR